jgi:sporulation integral membrane protein YtvI
MEESMEESKIITYIKIIINFAIAIAIALFLIFPFPHLLRFFMPFVIGWIISLLANPLVHFLEKRVKLLRKHSTVIIIVTVILLIVGILALIGILIYKEAKELMDDLPGLVDRIGIKLANFTDMVRQQSESLPPKLQRSVIDFIDGIDDSVNGFVANLELFSADRVGVYAKNMAEGFLYMIITILSAYFFTACKDEISSLCKKHLPASIVNYWRLIVDNFKAAFGGYFKAQFKIMIILMAIMFIGFEILQVRYSFLFALGIAVLDFLPVFGTGAILWPWAILDMLTGNYIRAISLVAIYLICQIVKQVLQPKMVGDSIGLHPLATLLLLFTGYRFYGITGMILAIPIGMVLVNLYRVGMFDRLVRGFKIIVHDLNEFRKF